MSELQIVEPIQVGVSQDKLSRLQALCEGWVREGRTPALGVLAARQGAIFLQDAWGKLTEESDSKPVATDSLFGMASCSKPVTAAAVMTLVEDGEIGLEQPLVGILPEFQGPETEQITIRHLLSHTSGLPARAAGDSLTAGEHSLVFIPGTQMAYSNVGYDLLGILVERVSGLSYDRFTRVRIFEPLGMHNTTFVHVGLDRERCVLSRPGTTYDWPADWEGLTSASSTLWSTPYDMGIFLQTFLNLGRYNDFQLLTRESVAAMTSCQVVGIPREMVEGVPAPPAGLGWFMLGGTRFPNYPESFSETSYGHSGSSGAFIWVDPAYDLIGAFLFVKIKEEFRPLDLFVDGLMECLSDDPEDGKRSIPRKEEG